MAHVAYFDESGDLDSGRRIFCISGYLIEERKAMEMDAAWGAALTNYDIPYFHAVECAHGTKVFKGMPPERRTRLAKELIALVKRYTIEGITVIAHAHSYSATTKSPDAYTHLAGIIAERSLSALRALRQDDSKLACFFESGHKSGHSAYNLLAPMMASHGTITLGGKKERRLLQAADLLAWHSTKYAADLQSKERPPRRDFLSLMEHNHTFYWAETEGEIRKIGLQFWPEKRMEKIAGIGRYDEDRNGPILVIKEDGEELPIVWVRDFLGCRVRQQASGIVQIKMTDMDSKPFLLQFDQKGLDTLLKGILTLARDMNLKFSIGTKARRFEVLSAEKHYIVNVDLGGPVCSFQIPAATAAMPTAGDAPKAPESSTSPTDAKGAVDSSLGTAPEVTNSYRDRDK